MTTVSPVDNGENSHCDKKTKKNNAEMQSWHIIFLSFMSHFYFIYTEWVIEQGDMGKNIYHDI